MPIRYKSINIIFGLLLGFVVFIFSPSVMHAQELSSGVAIPVFVQGENVVDGSVVCSYTDGIKVCDKEYDPSLYGVVTDNPAVSFQSVEQGDRRLVLTSGIAKVVVTSENGNINVGDLVTSSEDAGTAKKFENSGFVLGTALEAYESDDPEALGKIAVAINIHPEYGGAGSGAGVNLLALIRSSADAPLLEPLASLRYLLAVVVVLLSFALGFIYFGRISKTGIEAVGRNPLAVNTIRLSVILHIIITIVIVLTGLGLAYLILIL